MKQEIYKTLEILRSGGIILYPSDTIWGIGCDATNENAVKKIIEFKKIKDKYAMSVLLDTENRLHQWVHQIPDLAWDLINVSKKPITIIYSEGKNMAKSLLDKENKIPIRITHEKFSHELLKRFRKPIVHTSANISGTKTPTLFSKIDKTVLNFVDYVVNWRRNEIYKGKISSLIKLEINNEIKIIRK